MRESCSTQPVNEWIERRKREWDEHETRMNSEISVKILAKTKRTAYNMKNRRKTIANTA